MNTQFLPPGWAAEEVVACIGLVSDTHMPQRCASLPDALFAVLQGVDLLLHAGDLGELWVLDRLSVIAPLIAVHGNDDTPDALRELPYQQLITVAGHRILLCHSHLPDRALEMAVRREDAWAPKLIQRATQAQRAGAQLMVFGHTHIPMTAQVEGVLLINPGAIAAANFFTRQTRQTVALLFLRQAGAPVVVHVDLAQPTQRFQPVIDWGAGFKAALDQFSASLLAPELTADAAQLLQQNYIDRPRLIDALLRVAHRCWAGQQAWITRTALLQEIEQDAQLAAADKQLAAAVLAKP